MPIPNLPSLIHKIGKGAEGGHEFARIIMHLLASEYNGYYHELTLINDAAGDLRSADAHLWLRPEDMEVATFGLTELKLFQFKFYPSPLSSQHRAAIKKSAQAALQNNPKCSEWILVTPEDFLSQDAQWFEQLQEELNPKDKPQEVPHTRPLRHWGHTDILNLMLKHVHIGRRYYPEIDQPYDLGRPIIERVKFDLQQSAWTKSPDPDKEYYSLNVGFFQMLKEWGEYQPFDQLKPQQQQAFRHAYQILQTRQPQVLQPVATVEQFYRALLAPHRIFEEAGIPDPPAEQVQAVAAAMQSGWPHWRELKQTYPEQYPVLEWFHNLFGRTTDPIVELTIVNRSTHTQILYAVGIIVHDIWREGLGGPGPTAAIVPILAQVSIPMPYGKGKFTRDLDDPIHLDPQASARIVLRLADFMEAYDAIYELAVSFVVETSWGEIVSLTVGLSV